jgi:hypothetical protein
MIEIHYLVVPTKYYYYKPQTENETEVEHQWFKTLAEAEAFVAGKPKVTGLIWSIKPIRYLPLKTEEEKTV